MRFIDPDGRQVGNNNQPAKNSKYNIPTTAIDQTATKTVDPTLTDKPITSEGNLERLGRKLDDALKGSSIWETGIAVDGKSNGQKGMPATGNVITIMESTIELLELLTDYGGLGPTGKPSSEEIVTDKRSVSNDSQDEKGNEKNDSNKDTVIEMTIYENMTSFGTDWSSYPKDTSVKKKDVGSFPIIKDERTNK